MSVSLIDRTLSYLPINPESTKKEDLLDYIKSVTACGADYIEINSTILKLLEDEDLSERFIFRITSVSDMKLSLDYKFAYVVLPFALFPFFHKLSQMHSIIAEINTNEYAVQSDLLMLKDDSHINYISMLRLTGNLAVSDNGAEQLVTWYKQNFHIPLDICPLNTMLTGSSDAISFFRESCDALSLSFGRNNYYSSFEDFLINRQILRRAIMPPDAISALCSASLSFVKLFRSLPSGIEKLTASDTPSPTPVYDIENGLMYRPFKPGKKTAHTQENVIERQIKSIGLEKEIEEAIIEMFKKTNYSFYQNIIKRNIID